MFSEVIGLGLVVISHPGPAMATAAWAEKSEQVHSFDLVVYGATPAGIAAAIQAQRMGKSAVLLEPTNHIGGLTTSGLGHTDTGDKSVIGGISREFYRRIRKHYDDPQAWTEDRSRFALYRKSEDAMWVFEPRVAETILGQMLAEAKVTLVLGARLDRAQGPAPGSGVQKEGTRLLSLRTVSGDRYRGRAFIDASYEGDLMAAAGISTTIGRESNRIYGESLNGYQPSKNLHNHRFLKPVDPFKKPGDKASGLIFGVEAAPYPKEGEGDRRVQAYCFRMCMTKVAANRVDFVKPASYREDQYELLFRNLEAGDLRFPLNPVMMPNGKTDTNNNGAVSSDYIGFSNDYPEASDARRQEIVREHWNWQMGLMWTLKHHPRTPAAMRAMFQDWGLARDEFADNGHWPYQIYVREARRMVGSSVMTEGHCRGSIVVNDPVGMGSYNMDSHNCARIVQENGTVQNEGDIQVSPGGPYSISFQSLCPQRKECSNLLVPVCLSCSHIAYGSIRMEPVFFILGQSAATALCLAIDENSPIQDLNFGKLRGRLVTDGQILEKARAKRPGASQNLKPETMEGIVVDDTRAVKTGPWQSSSSLPGFVGDGYLHDGDGLKGAMAIRFEASLPKPGLYEVRIYAPPSSNRSKKVAVVVEAGANRTTLHIDQSKLPKEGYHSIGTFDFRGAAAVTIDNKETKGHVIADAVQWIPRKTGD